MATEVLRHLEDEDCRITVAKVDGTAGLWFYGPGKPAPDILISGPAFFRRLCHKDAFLDIFSNIKVVVLDEADMLLDGSYLKTIEALLLVFKR
jgi:hypothetical protein